MAYNAPGRLIDCPDCDGSGVVKGTTLPCLRCRGKAEVRGSKFNARPQVYNGHKYPSKAHAQRAAELDGRIGSGDVIWWNREVEFKLGPDFNYRVDFLVAQPVKTSSGERVVLLNCSDIYLVHAEDVKGHEPPAFRTVRKLWPKYGPCPLHVLHGKQVEVIEGCR